MGTGGREVRSPGPRPEHSRSAIAAAGVALADAGGLAAVSMRAVAGALGTAAASLYRYLTSRDELVALMVDAAMGELPSGRAGSGSWLDDLVGLARDQLTVYRRHPWLLEAGLHGRAFGPRTLDHFEECLRLLAPVSAPAATKMEAIALLTGVVWLFSRDVATAPLAPQVVFAAADAARHPQLVAVLSGPAGAGRRGSGPDLFETTLRGVLQELLTAAG